MEKMTTTDFMRACDDFAEDIAEALGHVKDDSAADPVSGALILLCYVMSNEEVAKAAASFLSKHPLNPKKAALDMAALAACRTIGVRCVRPADAEDKDSLEEMQPEGNA